MLLAKKVLWVSITALVTTSLSAPSKLAEQSENSHYIMKRDFPNYQDFTADEAGAAKTTQIAQGLQDALTVLRKVLASDQRIWDSSFKKYFAIEHEVAVRQIFEFLVAVPDSQDLALGSTMTGSQYLVVRGIDFTVANGTTIPVCEYARNGRYCVAYMDTPMHKTTGQAIGPSALHVCESPNNGYKFPMLKDKKCEDLDPYVSWKMTTFGGYLLLHELMHHLVVTRPVIQLFMLAPKHLNVVQKQNPSRTVGDYAYGPQKTRQLLNHKDESDLVIANADNFSWFANEVYWANMCGHTFGDPIDNINHPPEVSGANACDIM